MLEFSNVNLDYANKDGALRDISLSIGKGEFVFLMGHTGSGKSSLLKLIYRDEVPTSGEVYVNNNDVTDLSKSKVQLLRREIGVVFQDFKLLDYKTCGENVAYALEVTDYSADKIDERVDTVLDVVGLSDMKDRLPQELSGGEKQLTSIARAIVHNPPLLIADEPTGNLDSASAWRIVQILDFISSKGTTVILATHDREIVDRLKKRVVVIEGGRIVSDISPVSSESGVTEGSPEVLKL